jgi:hypothetical protein
MHYNLILLLLVLEIAVFLLGYAIGRRTGKREGMTEGMSLVPLELRKKLFETSKCPICSQELNIHTNYDNIHNREL